MMATYKLYYFDIKGRAEIIRMVLKQAGIEFEDIRFKKKEWLEKYKTLSPLGTCPWLEVGDNDRYGGSLVVARYIAEQTGLAGTNDIENAQLAGIADTVFDWMDAGIGPYFVSDLEKKKKLMEEFVKKSPKWCDVLEGTVTTSGWIYGQKITWVDLLIAVGIDMLCSVYPTNDLFVNYPKLSALKAKVEEQPNIAKWLKERPQTIA